MLFKKTPRAPGPSWIAGKLADLAALLRQLPADRQRAFADALDAPEAPQGDERAPDEATPTPGDEPAQDAAWVCRFPLVGDLATKAEQYFRSPEWKYLPSEAKDELAEAIVSGDPEQCARALDRIADLLPRLRRP